MNKPSVNRVKIYKGQILLKTNSGNVIVNIINGYVRGSKMRRILTLLTILLIAFPAFSDTFVNRSTGESFDGYATNLKNAHRTQVRIGGGRAEYLNLQNYEIIPNNKGRKQRIYLYNLTAPLNLHIEADTLRDSMPLVANQGPYFILLELDSPYGEIDIARKIINTIKEIDYCKTICWIKNDKYGGAFEVAASVALACDKVYIEPTASIGAPPLAIAEANGLSSTEKSELEKWTAYSAALAKENNRNPLFVRAMFDTDIKISEFKIDSNSVFVETDDGKTEEEPDKIWTEKGTLLTLTAEQGDRLGLVDGIVESRSEIVEKMDAEDCRLLKDTRLTRARRELDNAQQEFSNLLSMIEKRKPVIQNLQERLRRLERDIRRARELIYRSRYHLDIGRRITTSSERVTVQELRDMLNYRDDVLADLIRRLENQLRDYRRTKTLSEEFTDLKEPARKAEISSKLDEVESQLDEATYWPKYER